MGKAEPQRTSPRSRRRAIASLGAVLATVAIAVGLWAALAGAATTLTVTTTADTGAGAGACGSSSITTAPSPLSLREATCLANNIGGAVNITVPAGTYKLANGELLPGRAPGQTVNITGAGAAATIIDGQGLSRVLNIDAPTLGNVKSTITGVTITGGADSTFGGAGILDGSDTKALPDELTLESVVVTGNQANGQSQSVNNRPGGGVSMAGGKLTVNNSTFTNNGSYSSPGSAISYFTQGGGAPQGMKITNSTFSSNHATNSVKTIPNGGTVYTQGPGAELEVADSRFTNNDVIASNTGVAVGAGIWDERGNLTVARTTFSGNTVSNSVGTATGAAVALTASTNTVTMRYDRIAGNTPGASAVAATAGTIDAAENWWGCNAGPGNAGCDGTSGTVTSTPRLKLNASASPATVFAPNGISTLTADFLTDSAGQAVAVANLSAFSGASVTWKEPTPSPATVNGSTAATTTAIAAGKATAAYDSQSAPAGPGGAVAAFDNASQPVGLAVDQKPAITQNPANQMVLPGATATFTAGASGTPTPSVQWERSTDGGSTFAAIPGATATTYSFTAASGETGYQFRAVFKSTIEGTPYEATTTAATLTVGRATTTLTSTATSATVGSPVHDTATLGGGGSPGGNLIFNAYGPNDATCSGAIAFTSTIAVGHGNGAYESGAKTFAAPGEYRWTISYSGDANNEPATSACNAANEKSTVSRHHTTLTTSATDGVAGASISDTATLGGGTSPSGTITFEAFGPNDATCANAAAFTKSVTVAANGEFSSTSFEGVPAGTYRWTASYSGDTDNEASTSPCGAAGETSTVSKASPTISTSASDAAIGGPIHDTATIAGGFDPGATVDFKAYGPNDATCSTTAVFDESVKVTGDGPYASPDFTAVQAGTYRWTAAYSGDADNNPVASACGATGETSTVAKAIPTISTVATDGTLGGAVHDTATIAGGFSPGGILTFIAFGPNDTGCTKGPVFSKFVAVGGNGEYGSTDFTPTAAGSYNWVAEYSGDGNDEGIVSTCEAAGETSTVAKASPTLSTIASGAMLGSPIHDTATLGGAVTPGGSIEFKVYGPNDATCANTAAVTETVTVSANGTYGSGDFTPSASGAYRWTAAYSGDANNNAAVSPCNASGETSQVANATPTISTTATDAAIGGPIHDTALLANGAAPGGTITFRAYGPGDATCANTAAETETVSVSGNGSYGSGDFTPAIAGSYRWVASYSGDAGNEAVTSACGEAGETSTVGQAAPTISTMATSAKIGNPVNDTAMIAGGHSAGGNIVFKAFGPANASCTGTPAETKTVAVNGDGSYGSGGVSFTALGEYRWTAEYTGDANNEAATSACGAAGESSGVTQATPTISTAATGATVGGPVHDSATLAGGYNAGGSLTFEAFGPADATCAAAPLFEAVVPVNGGGTYRSDATGEFTPGTVGEYRWVAAYSGDTDNAPAEGQCGDLGETSVVSPVPPPPVTPPEPPVTPPTPQPAGPSAPQPAPTPPCVPPTATANGYVPRTKVKSGLVPGVRARIAVPAPSDLEVAATLTYRLDGRSRSVDLGTQPLADPGVRNLRLALPTSVREALPLGSRVRLALAITAVPAGAPACATPAQTELRLRTRVVRVLVPRQP